MKKGLLMFALIIIAVFIGGFIGKLAVGVDGISWLGEPYQIGISTFDVDLYLMVLTLGVQMKFCLAEVLMLLIALVSYPKLSKMIFG